MRKILLCLILLLHIRSGSAHAQNALPNKAIAETERHLIGEWKLKEGLPGEDENGDRIWSFAKDHTLRDNKEELQMDYLLVQNAAGDIWMLMQYSQSNSGAIIMRIRLEGDTLKLDRISKNSEGTYAAIPGGGLVFERKKEG